MDTSYFCVRTKPRSEAIAAASISSHGFVVVAPRIEEVRKTIHMDNLVIVPMFRGYIFAKLNLEQFFRLGRIHGVQSLVSFDGPPPAVEEAFIDQLRSRMGKDGVIRLGAVSRKGPEFLRGEKVQIDAGPFLGYTGIFQEGLDSDGRVKVLLDSLYSSTMQPIVQVPRSYVARIHAH